MHCAYETGHGQVIKPVWMHSWPKLLRFLLPVHYPISLNAHQKAPCHQLIRNHSSVLIPHNRSAPSSVDSCHTTSWLQLALQKCVMGKLSVDRIWAESLVAQFAPGRRCLEIRAQQGGFRVNHFSELDGRNKISGEGKKAEWENSVTLLLRTGMERKQQSISVDCSQ